MLLQLLSGSYLGLYYEPSLEGAYASVQHLYNESIAQGWIRDSHRWLALFIFAAVLIHLVRSLFRKDFLRPKKRIPWLTGLLLLLGLLATLATGFVLPWEWKAYWFMEMVPNLLGGLPLVGDSIKSGLISFFTLSRAYIAHIVLLPVICIVLIDIHVFRSLRNRKRGIRGYLVRHGLITLPFVVVIVALAVAFPMPTQDPEIIPLPLAGRFIPTPEYVLLFFYVPFMYFEEPTATILGLYLPVSLFLVMAIAPFFLKRKPPVESGEPGTAMSRKTKTVLVTAGVVCAVLALFAPIYTVSYRSPTFGCNSCHNIYMGTRMGIPPAQFKDREKLPLLDDYPWMVEHWYEPQQTW